VEERRRGEGGGEARHYPLFLKLDSVVEVGERGRVCTVGRTRVDVEVLKRQFVLRIKPSRSIKEMTMTKT
jgi:hypothetical protein